MSDDSHNGQVKIGLSLIMKQPPPRPLKQAHERKTVEQKVRHCIERIDNGCGTEVDFLILKKLKAAIQSQKSITPRMQNILDMVEPIIRRFGYYF